MASVKVAFRREHTGTHTGDNVQRLAQVGAQRIGSIEERLAKLEALFLQGRSTIEMRNVDQIITATQLGCFVIQTTGALSAARNVRGFPRPKTEAETYCRLIHNNVTGGFNVNFIDAYGSSQAFGAGGSAVAQFTPTGIILYVL